MIIINLGTGTPGPDTSNRATKRPIWTNLLPNALVEALGLVADLTKLATESESCAERLAYISESDPAQLFFCRLSADTGIDQVKLDDWRAVTGGVSEPSLVEARTRLYLENPDVVDKLGVLAGRLADVYEMRHLPTKMVDSTTVALSEEKHGLDVATVAQGQSKLFDASADQGVEPGRCLVPWSPICGRGGFGMSRADV